MLKSRLRKTKPNNDKINDITVRKFLHIFHLIVSICVRVPTVEFPNYLLYLRQTLKYWQIIDILANH